MPGNHGGAREGAGRKTNAEKYAPQIATFTDECAAYLKPAFRRLWDLIEGGVRVEVKTMPAGLVTRKGVARDDDGQVIRDDKGKPVIEDVRIYPERNPDEMGRGRAEDDHHAARDPGDPGAGLPGLRDPFPVGGHGGGPGIGLEARAGRPGQPIPGRARCARKDR